MLDSCVDHLHKHGGAKEIQAHLPASLDRKLDYLSRALKVGLVDPSDREGLANIVADCHRLKTFRHILVHGQPIEFGEEGRVIVEHCRVRAAARVLSRTVYSQAQMRRHYQNTRKLMLDFASFLSSENASKSQG
jgi:hypothetical protein